MEEVNIEKKKSTTKRRRSSRTMAVNVGVTDESANDECVSDGSDVPVFSSSQKKRFLTAEKLKSFLAQTKNQHGVKVGEHFPDLGLFIASARLHMSQREESGLTDQEAFRLKKLVLKAKRQLSSDGKGSLGYFI